MASRRLGTRTATVGSALGSKPPLDRHKSSNRFVPDMGLDYGGGNQESARKARMGDVTWLYGD